MHFRSSAGQNNRRFTETKHMPFLDIFNRRKREEARELETRRKHEAARFQAEAEARNRAIRNGSADSVTSRNKLQSQSYIDNNAANPPITSPANPLYYSLFDTSDTKPDTTTFSDPAPFAGVTASAEAYTPSHSSNDYSSSHSSHSSSDSSSSSSYDSGSSSSYDSGGSSDGGGSYSSSD